MVSNQTRYRFCLKLQVQVRCMGQPNQTVHYCLDFLMGKTDKQAGNIRNHRGSCGPYLRTVANESKHSKVCAVPNRWANKCQPIYSFRVLTLN